MSPRPKDTMSNFGKVIARLLNDERLQKGVTQAELAESTGISQSQISKQLRGTRDINIDELDAIVTALNLSIVELIRTRSTLKSSLMTESEIQLSALVEEIKALDQEVEAKKTILRLLLKELHERGYSMYRLSKITGYAQPTIKAYIQAVSSG